MAAQLDHVWALEFMPNAFYGGRSIRTRNVLCERTRERLAIDLARSLSSVRVIRLLDKLVALHRAPAALRVDNGPERTCLQRSTAPREDDQEWST